MSDAIREAAAKHDWEGCKHALSDRLVQTEPLKSAHLCVEYFNIYSARFDDVRILFSLQIQELQDSKLFSAQGKDLSPFPDMGANHKDPKVRAVHWALFYFWTGARWYDNDQVRAEHLTEAFASMINLFRLQHPEWIPDQYASDTIRQLSSGPCGMRGGIHFPVFKFKLRSKNAVMHSK